MSLTSIGQTISSTSADGTATSVRLRAGATTTSLLLELLARPVADADVVARLVETDPALTVHLLRVANAGVGDAIDTVPAALEAIDSWTLTRVVEDAATDTIPVVPELWRVLARAMTCERLCDDRRAYTAGLLSAVSELYGMPAEDLLATTGVSRSVTEAVTARRGPLGAALGALLAYLADDARQISRHGFAPRAVYAAYVEAATTAMTTEAVIAERGPARPAPATPDGPAPVGRGAVVPRQHDRASAPD